MLQHDLIRIPWLMAGKLVKISYTIFDFRLRREQSVEGLEIKELGMTDSIWVCSTGLQLHSFLKRVLKNGVRTRSRHIGNHKAGTIMLSVDRPA
jgi:hypothetical protein